MSSFGLSNIYQSVQDARAWAGERLETIIDDYVDHHVQRSYATEVREHFSSPYYQSSVLKVGQAIDRDADAIIYASRKFVRSTAAFKQVSVAKFDAEWDEDKKIRVFRHLHENVLEDLIRDKGFSETTKSAAETALDLKKLYGALARSGTLDLSPHNLYSEFVNIKNTYQEKFEEVRASQNGGHSLNLSETNQNNARIIGMAAPALFAGMLTWPVLGVLSTGVYLATFTATIIGIVTSKDIANWFRDAPVALVLTAQKADEFFKKEYSYGGNERKKLTTEYEAEQLLLFCKHKKPKKVTLINCNIGQDFLDRITVDTKKAQLVDYENCLVPGIEERVFGPLPSPFTAQEADEYSYGGIERKELTTEYEAEQLLRFCKLKKPKKVTLINCNIGQDFLDRITVDTKKAQLVHFDECEVPDIEGLTSGPWIVSPNSDDNEAMNTPTLGVDGFAVGGSGRLSIDN